MDFRHTRHQRLRGTRADAEQNGKLYLIKNVSSLEATYQIRLLTFRAHKESLLLEVRVPKFCQLRPSLQKLISENSSVIKVTRY